MRKTIKIFIASSIVEFANERMAIENFIRKISDNFEEQYDVKIKPILCENLDDAYSTVRKQEEYNEEIRQSELCFFIFFTKAGQYTQEEFEVARKAFEESGKPKIYTYFKIIKDGEGEQNLYDFMKKLDEVFGHYYGTFDHVDTIKLRILLSLKLREMDFLEIKSEDGKCVVGGKSVMSLDNVAEFQNNSNLANLQKELKEVEQKYYEMKPIYAKGGCDDTFYHEYCKVASRRQDLIDEIEQLQKAIFNMSMRMSTDETHGEVTLRQKEAYRLFELGDYDGCMAVLDAEEIKNDYLRQIKMLEEQKATVCKKFIRENKTAIDILMTMTDYQGRFDEIVRRYEDIVPIALAEGIELNVVYDYVYYLWQQNNHTRAIEIGEKLNNHPTWNEKSDYAKACLYNVLGNLSSEVYELKNAEKYHLKSIEKRETLAQEKPEEFNSDLAMSYNNVGVFYYVQHSYNKAYEYYLKSIEIRESFEEMNLDLAMVYHNIAVLYMDIANDTFAEKYYFKAIEIYETLAKENFKQVNPALARSYNSIGEFFYKRRLNNEYAKKYILKALEIRKTLAQENPERFIPDLAISYSTLGSFFEYVSDKKQAQESFERAISIYESLIQKSPERFYPKVEREYINFGDFYCRQGNYELSEKYYLKSIAIAEVLAQEKPERFNLNLAKSYNHVGDFYKSQSNFKKTEEYYLKAIAIREGIAKKSFDRIGKDLDKNVIRNNLILAEAYDRISLFYHNQENYKFERAYKVKSIKIYEQLATKYPEECSPLLANEFLEYGTGIKKFRYTVKALILVQKYPEHPVSKQIIEKSLALANNYPDNPICKMIIERLSKH